MHSINQTFDESTIPLLTEENHSTPPSFITTIFETCFNNGSACLSSLLGRLQRLDAWISSMSCFSFISSSAEKWIGNWNVKNSTSEPSKSVPTIPLDSTVESEAKLETVLQRKNDENPDIFDTPIVTSTYEGERDHGVPYGQGIRYYSNGDVERGFFVDGNLKDGIREYQNGLCKVEKGIFVGGDLKTGIREYRWSGAIEEGTFANWGLEYGIFKYKNGKIEEGFFKEGTLIDGRRQYKGGAIEEGTFINGNLKYGTHKYRNEAIDEGIFENTYLKHGTRKYREGLIIEGNFINNAPQGEAILHTSNTSQKVFIKNNGITNLNRSNIGDFPFFAMLYSIDRENAGILYYVSGILVDYLLNYFQNSTKNLQIVAPLMEVHKLSLMTPEERLEKITQTIEQNKPCLFNYGFKDHAMLLNLVPSQDGQFIDCEIFNSGEGLFQHHKRDKKTQKFQTMKVIRIPREQLTPTKLKQLIDYLEEFKDADEAYQAISKIDGAHDIELIEPILQIEQQSDNCSLECYFAYLRNKLPPDIYKKLRRDLFIASLFARLQQEKASGSQNNSLKEHRVRHKIKKDPIFKQLLKTLDLGA